MNVRLNKNVVRGLVAMLLILSMVVLVACQTTQDAGEAAVEQAVTEVETAAETVEETAAEVVEEAATAVVEEAPVEAATEAPAAEVPTEEPMEEPMGDPAQITIFRGGVTIDWENDPVIQAIEELNNVEIDFVTADWGEIDAVRNLAMSTEEDIDIYHHVNTSQQWIDDELIIPIDEYVNADDHPYLYTLINSPLFAPMKRDGQTYYIPMLSDGSDWVWLVRTDWMEELGLDMPTNEVEFRDMLQAFKDRDPDGRAVGFQVEGGQTIRRSMVPVQQIFGIPANFPNPERVFWVGDDGQLQPTFTSQNMKDALTFMNGLYQDGLINTDFPTLTSFPQLSEQYIQADKASVSWFPNGGNFPLSEGAEAGFIPPFSAEGYEFARGEGVFTQGWISLSSMADDPQAAIDLLEFFNSPKGRELLVMGIDGVDFSDFDPATGSFVRNEENWQFDTVYYPLHFYLGNGTMRGIVPIAEYGDVVEGQSNAQIFEPTVGGVGLRDTFAMSNQWLGAPMMFQYVEFPELSDTLTTINDAIITGWTEIITADPATIDAEWDEYLAELDAAGLPDWTGAYQAYYDENLK
jgi:ABC-type glycerol-3-phosphate transport system substrate-binding protein